VYIGVTNTLAMLRLLPSSGQAKDAEILALRYQVMVLRSWLSNGSCTASRSGSALPTGPCSPRCYTDYPAPCSAGSGSWYVQGPYCAGAVT
jgi:hypothetical protein